MACCVFCHYCFAEACALACSPQLDACLFRGGSGGGADCWWRGVRASLFKLFVGPPGTVTRLHYDAGDAHGWLAQLWGAKLFVLFPPSDTGRLARMPGEVRRPRPAKACTCHRR